MMEKSIKFEVLVRCTTFNHAHYIQDALNGFTMQKTSFPFVCTIIDDASTDGEQDVIKKYLEDNFELADNTTARNEETDDYRLIFSRHKTNRNCFFAVLFLKYNHYSIRKPKLHYISEWNDDVKYIALCEGDDYWIHPNKLQMQYDALEADPNIGLCYTKSYEYNQEKEALVDGKILAKNIPVDFASFLLYEPTITLTAFYRKELIVRYNNDLVSIDKTKWKMGDTPLWLWMSLNSKIAALDEITAVYRVLPESASHSNDVEKLLSFRKSYLDIRLFFIDKYKKDQQLKEKVYDSYYKEVINIAYNYCRPYLYFSTLIKKKNRSINDWIGGCKLLAKYIIPLK